MNKLTGATPDIAENNIQELMRLFPEVMCEGKVDFDKLKQLLGEYVEDSKERYNFTWNGKGRALRISQTPSMGTLRPCKEESKDWDTTENLYIEGDNLEVLKLLQKSYHGKIKMIYIDPPYNTGNDFVYPDDFSDNIENYKRITGQIDDEGNRISSNSEASGRYHTDWLNMMYPRLRLARNLLTDDGVIFISIDDNEIDNLKKLCNEIFGEDNAVADLVWRKKAGGANDSVDIAVEHEYIVCYKKRINGIRKIPLSAERIKEYKYSDEKEKTHGKYLVKNLDDKSLQDSKGLHFDITCPDGSVLLGSENQWKCNEATFEERLKDNRIEFKMVKDEWKVYYKLYLNEEKGQLKFDDNGDILQKGRNLSSIIDDVLNSDGSKDMKDIFNIAVFSYPKPVELIKKLLQAGTDKDSMVLDFFSGSATTAQSVMALNKEDGGSRKYIMVQLPEEIDEKEDAFKEGYSNICEIGKERMRRAGLEIDTKEIKYDEKDVFTNGLLPDVGFKVFKLDSSNLKKWQPNSDNIENTLIDTISNFIQDRTTLDVLYEIIIKMGIEISQPIIERAVDDEIVYIVKNGEAMIYLGDIVSTNITNAMIEVYIELHPEEWKVVFKDGAFDSDSKKTNIKEILKSAGLEEDSFITV